MSFDAVRNVYVNNFNVIRNKCFSKLTPAATRALEAAESYTRSFFENERRTLEARGAEGLIIEGHGDLRTEHVSFPGRKVVIIDCVEFSEALRTVDILGDIAFLRMDLDFRRRSDLAELFLEGYAQAFSGAYNRRLLDFYSVYRAMVRAKIAVLSTDQRSGDEAAVAASVVQVENYLALASRYAWQLRGPVLAVMSGLMGVGKSTLAQHIGAQCYAVVLRSDVIRKELYPANVSDRRTPFGEGIYAPEATTATYAEMLRRAEKELTRGNPVILDASFAKSAQRDAVAKLARKLGVEFVFVECRLDETETLRRLAAREGNLSQASDGRRELYFVQKDHFEPISRQIHPCISLSTAETIQDQAGSVLSALGNMSEQK